MAPLIENPYNFYKIGTFEWYVSKSDYSFTNYTYLSKDTFANFQNNGKI